MADDSSGSTIAPLPEAERRRGQTFLIRVALADSFIYSVVLGNMATLYILAIGGTVTQVGIRNTFANLAPVAQLIGLLLIRRLGKARLGALGRTTNLIPMTLLIALALSGRHGGAWPWCAVGAFALLNLSNVIGNTGWWPLLQDMTSGEGVGTFFSRMRFKLRVLEVALPLVVGAYLGANPSTARFVGPIILAMGAMTVGAYMLRQAPERRIPPPEKPLYRRLLEAARIASVRSYVEFLVVRAVLIGLPAGFGIVMLKLHGMTDNFIMWTIPMMAVGHMAGLNLWAGVIDGHGSRSVVAISTLSQAVIGLAWFVLPSDPTLLIVWAVPFYLISGFFQGAFMMGRTQAMMDAIPAERQADGFTLSNVAEALFAAMGASVGTMCFERLTATPSAFLGIDLRLLYLGLAQLSLVAVWFVSRRLTRHAQETPARELMRRAFKQVRG